MYTLDDGTPIDINNAFRRLSDANLALSKSSLAVLSSKGHRRWTEGEDGASAENARLVKDYYSEDENVVESSDDEHSHTSDEEGQRGRKTGGREADDDPEGRTIGMGRAKGPRQALSLMAAAEEEREEPVVHWNG
jgi:hypothetical protein